MFSKEPLLQVHQCCRQPCHSQARSAFHAGQASTAGAHVQRTCIRLCTSVMAASAVSSQPASEEMSTRDCTTLQSAVAPHVKQ